MYFNFQTDRHNAIFVKRNLGMMKRASCKCNIGLMAEIFENIKNVNAKCERNVQEKKKKRPDEMKMAKP